MSKIEAGIGSMLKKVDPNTNEEYLTPAVKEEHTVEVQKKKAHGDSDEEKSIDISEPITLDEELPEPSEPLLSERVPKQTEAALTARSLESQNTEIAQEKTAHQL